MDEEEINKLFLSVLEHASENTKPVREVFSVLVRSTLRYRDQMLTSKGIRVSVEDVRIALQWLVPSLKSGRLPETLDNIRLGLLKIWLDELRYLGNPSAYLS